MSDWKQKIEAQIAWLKSDLEPHAGEPNDHERAVIAAIRSLQALLDVAVAADEDRYVAMCDALDKLRYGHIDEALLGVRVQSEEIESE